MTTVTGGRPASSVRGSPSLRRPTDALAGASIGTVPILWNNVDLPDLGTVEADTVLDEIARTGYEGTQEGRGFPRGQPLRAMLADRGLRLAEVYVALPCTADGPSNGALQGALDRLEILHAGGGDVLVAALDGSADRSPWSGRAGDAAAPRLTEAGWRRLASLVDEIARETASLGHRLAWHQHTGTWVETPEEADFLFTLTDPGTVGICLDVGHWTVGGGDPVEALERYRDRVIHVHLKDVDPGVLATLRAGDLTGWGDAIRARLFTELGAGVLDLPAILAALDARGFDGWLMVEQDSCWGPPSESAAIGRRVLAAELRRLGGARVEGSGRGNAHG